MLKASFIGSWQLCAFDIVSPSGTTKPWGNNAHGLLHYSPQMTMSVSINRDLQGPASDPRAILESVLFYAGRYSVEGTIIHHFVDNATDPTRIGQDLVREAILDGESLTLVGSGEFGTARLVWKRFYG